MNDTFLKMNLFGFLPFVPFEFIPPSPGSPLRPGRPGIPAIPRVPINRARGTSFNIVKLYSSGRL